MANLFFSHPEKLQLSNFFWIFPNFDFRNFFKYRNRKGVEVVRWARFTKDCHLQFYEAEFVGFFIKINIISFYRMTSHRNRILFTATFFNQLSSIMEIIWFNSSIVINFRPIEKSIKWFLRFLTQSLPKSRFLFCIFLWLIIRNWNLDGWTRWKVCWRWTNLEIFYPTRYFQKNFIVQNIIYKKTFQIFIN